MDGRDGHLSFERFLQEFMQVLMEKLFSLSLMLPASISRIRMLTGAGILTLTSITTDIPCITCLSKMQWNNAILEIELAEITLDWFTFDVEVEKVDFYVFTLDPAIDEVLVDVYAVIEKEKTPADALTGITLKVDETVVDVKKNDTYKIEKQP